MEKYIEIHRLMPRPPSNPNRDETGRPKTAFYGGYERLRHSSQSEKRALRESSIFARMFSHELGLRTRDFGGIISDRLVENHGMDVETAAKVADKMIAGIFVGKAAKEKAKKEKKKSKKADGETADQGAEQSDEKVAEDVKQKIPLVFLAPQELDSLYAAIDRYVEDPECLPGIKDILQKNGPLSTAIDIAFFGRMVAFDDSFNVEAAVSVSHSLSTHEAMVEDDYFTAVDDRLKAKGIGGAGHLDEAQFGSGLMYGYMLVNAELLAKNLQGYADIDVKPVIAKALTCLVEAYSASSPSGKQTSYAHHERASYMLVEVGSEPLGNMMIAFHDPIDQRAEEGLLQASISAFQTTRSRKKAAYPGIGGKAAFLNVMNGEGSITDLTRLVNESVGV